MGCRCPQGSRAGRNNDKNQTKTTSAPASIKRILQPSRSQSTRQQKLLLSPPRIQLVLFPAEKFNSKYTARKFYQKHALLRF
ncbi:MAG: hypothetical protein A2096_16625 [Spirochaetes bacterium GWF1_41_5]|nr:MAG: hypothetical protein A2096_16625 [Spirochaetes bacterium GWF1_41_5]